MFDQFVGLPVHVLVNHAAVVLVPLTVVATLVFAVVPRWRWVLRWPVLVAAAVSLVTGYVTAESGEVLLARLGLPQVPPALALHQERGERLVWLLVGFLVIVIVAFFTLGGPTRLQGGRDRAGAARPIQWVVAVLLVAMSVWVGVQVVLTGDAGARAVWGGL